MPNGRMEIETKIARGENALDVGVRTLGAPTFQTCPECHGSMVGIEEGQIKRYRCHTGHAFTPGVLAERTRRSVEGSLGSALAHLEEFQVLLTELQSKPWMIEGNAEAAVQTERLKALIRRFRDLAINPIV